MRRKVCRTIVSMAVVLAAGLFGGMAVAQETTMEIPSLVVIKNVSVWNGTSDGAVAGLDVLVVGDKIRKIAKDIPTAGTYHGRRGPENLEENRRRDCDRKLPEALGR